MNECTIDVFGQQDLHTTKKLSADKDSREWLAGVTRKLAEGSKNGGAGSMPIKLNDSGAYSKAEEEVLGDGGKTAVGGAEHNDDIRGGKVGDHLSRSHVLEWCCG